jgi:hypothetical protein
VHLRAPQRQPALTTAIAQEQAPRRHSPRRSSWTGRPDALLRRPPQNRTCPLPSIRLKQALQAHRRTKVPGRLPSRHRRCAPSPAAHSEACSRVNGASASANCGPSSAPPICDAVKIRCRNRRTLVSTCRRSTWRQPSTSSSGPFTTPFAAASRPGRAAVPDSPLMHLDRSDNERAAPDPASRSCSTREEKRRSPAQAAWSSHEPCVRRSVRGLSARWRRLRPARELVSGVVAPRPLAVLLASEGVCRLYSGGA